MSETPIAGETDRRFSRVRDAFAENFSRGDDTGAAFAVFHEGACVVDLVGGFADKDRTAPWGPSTIVCVYSSGKAAVALLFARAASEGRLDYDAPVAAAWPEFSANGKSAITIAQILSHQAGLCGFPEEMAPETWLDREAIVEKLAAMAPLWPPGAASGYHPQTFGFLADEIFRRATGRSIAATLRDDFHDAFGLDIHCGLDAAAAPRAAYMSKPSRAPDLGGLTALKDYAFLKPWSAPARVSREAWLAAELPASNMHASARALAEIVHPFADGGVFRGTHILSDRAQEAALKTRIIGDDLVLPFCLDWAAGVMTNSGGHFGPSPTAFGHAGFGGSAVMFDPARRLSCAYVMGKMSHHLVGDPRASRLISSVYDALY